MDTSPPRSVELFVRSLSRSSTPATDHAARVQNLEATDRVESATVTVWGAEVGLANTVEQTETGQYFLDRIAEFRSWTDDHGVTMEPFFETRHVHSSVSGEEYVTLSLPVTCLAEYDGDQLVHVAPYSTGSAICSVADRLERLADSEAAPTPLTEARKLSP